MVTYSDLAKFTAKQISKLISITNEQPSVYYNANRSKLVKLLKDYKGPANYEAIANFLNPEPDIFNLQPGFYTTQAKSHEERLEAYEAINPPIFNLQPGFYTTQAKSHEERKKNFEKVKLAHEQIMKAISVIKSINYKPLTGEKWIKRNKDKSKSGERIIEFDLTQFDKHNRKYFTEHIKDVLMLLISKMKYGQQWLCAYSFEGNVMKTSTLSEQHIQELINQMKKEDYIKEVEEDNAQLQEEEYDFFATNIKNLNKIMFYDITDYPDLKMSDIKRGKVKKSKKQTDIEDDPVYQALVNGGASEEVIEQYKTTKRKAMGKKQYRSRNGKFWKYTLNIPINLERYMIFNEVSKRTAQLMTRDNCFTYACIQSGLDDSIINQMREIIRVKSFPQSKIQTIANETHIAFKINIVDIETDNHNNTHLYTPEDDEPFRTIELLLIDGHYMINEPVAVSSFFIEHYEEIIKKVPSWDIEKMSKVYMFDNGRPKIRNSIKTPILNIIKACFKANRFEPIIIGDVITYSSLIYKEPLTELKSLNYDQKYCVRKKEPYKAKNEKDCKPSYVVYADFECSTDGIHKAFNICYESNDSNFKGSIWGSDCAVKFLEILKDNTAIYYHNLSYDINFILNKLSSIRGTPIIKGSRTMTIEGTYNGKHLLFKDSYTIISKPLKMFPEMFKLETGPKEVFPYTYYTSTLLKDDNRIGSISEAAKHVADKETFIHNINNIQGCKLGEDSFDLEKYSTYYCSQDVRILKEGFERFRKDLLTAFNLDAYDFVSICSIANKYFEENVYYKNGNLYDLANTPREFISRCIQGGRCMLSDNKKQINESNNNIVDFDAVSLYPSAIARLYTLEGIPKVLTKEMCNTDYLLSHLFTDDQTKPTNERYISAFYVEIIIKDIGIKRHFPLIVVDDKYNPNLKGVDRSSNTCCRMFVNHITLQDLITFQKCKIEVVRGYYYDGNRDLRIRNEVKKLFELRLKYKKEGNPLQEVIKLILNSIYGKTILKPIETKTRFIKDDDAIRFLRKNYNSIVEFEPLYGSNMTIFKCLKPIVKHFNFCPLGVDILAMSKRIMNEVFCLAEDNGLRVFYQDTDSGHYYEKDIKTLQQLFKAKYNRELIGKNLGQFHSDFAEIDKGHESKAIKSIFVGKKTYIDMLCNDINNIAFHCRMKGIKQDVIAIRANQLFPNSVNVLYDESTGLFKPVSDYNNSSSFSVMELYRCLYNGDEIEFDLCSGHNPCFDKKNNFTIITKSTFIRKLKF